MYRIFAAILNTAVDDRLLARSPAIGVRLPRQARDEVQPPTVDHVEALIDVMPDRYKALIFLADGTGLRQGECRFGLTVDRVDFLRRTITVDRQLILAGTGRPEFGPPKTAASVRTVALPRVLSEALAAHLERWPVGTDGLIFTNERGDPLRRNRFGEILRATVSQAGLDGLRFHDLRHPGGPGTRRGSSAGAVELDREVALAIPVGAAEVDVAPRG